MATSAPFFRVEGISKSFPGVRALDNVSLELRAGEVHALTGENGSGKSTLSKIIGGLYQPDAGTIWVNGEEVTMANPAVALRRGIVANSQELTPPPSLRGAEN